MAHEDAEPRSAEFVVPIAAPADAVWRALTDPSELERWFPLDASVKPGLGGQFTLRWRDAHVGDDWPILAWEPLRRLAVGMPKPPGAPAPAHIVTDFVLESKGGSTVLRVVASGFDSDAEWDEFFHGIRRGWRYELRSLRHYLEHHRGQARTVAWAHATFSCSYEQAWTLLFGAGGWVSDAPLDQARDGDRYRLTAPDGTVTSGVVHIVQPPYDFSGTMDELNGALLRIQLDPSHTRTEANIWVAAYGVPPARMESLQTSWQESLSTLMTGQPA